MKVQARPGFQPVSVKRKTQSASSSASAMRVGERCGGGRAGRAGALHHRRQHDRGCEGRDGERRDEPVETEAERHLAHAASHEHPEAEVAGRVEGEVERVAERGVGRSRVVRQHGRVVDLAGGPEHQRDAQAEPGPALEFDCRGPRQAEEGGADDQAVVEPIVEEAVERRLPDPEGGVGDQEGDAGERQHLGQPQHHADLARQLPRRAHPGVRVGLRVCRRMLVRGG